jgi:hypothetical protein
LETLEALSRVQEGIKERMKTVKNEAEKKELDRLTCRLFAADKCKWDMEHQAKLWQLFMEPERVGLVFKLRDRVHRVVCKRHEQ